MKIVCLLFLVPLCCAALHCPQNCKNAVVDVETRTCSLGCADGHYSASCCQTCPSRCKTCVDSGNCDQCDTGFYGHICEFSCDLCEEKKCEKNGCTEGCIEGYFTETVESFLWDGIKYTACRACRSTCSSCDSYGQCTSCIDGYSGPTCCKDCPQISGSTTAANTPTCGDESFVSSNGQCIRCPSNCVSCISYTNCTKCKDDYNGLSCSDFNCRSISHHCEKCKCLLRYCHKRDYICSECREGFHGLRCEFRCGPNCGNDTACDNEGKCLHGCKRGFWGVRCTQKCSIGCEDQTCSKLTGHCNCATGYSTVGGDSQHGQKCELVVTDTGKVAQSGVTRGPEGVILTQSILVVFTFLIINFLNK